jgi:phosphoglycolate phosphatase
MKQAALLFDLDGTLVDSVGDLAAAVNALLGELGRAPLSETAITAMVGDGVTALVERALAASGGPAPTGTAPVARFAALYEAHATRLTRPYSGVVTVLAGLAGTGIAMAVCTNKLERVARQVIDGLGLGAFFPLVLGGDSLPFRKPDPRFLRAALDRLGAAPARAAMVGDHRNDVLAAQAAGLKAIFASYGYGGASLGALRPDAVIDHFADLPHLLQVIWPDAPRPIPP